MVGLLRPRTVYLKSNECALFYVSLRCVSLSPYCTIASFEVTSQSSGTSSATIIQNISLAFIRFWHCCHRVRIVKLPKEC